MQVILLERVGNHGQMGDVVRVRDGFARNFLLPQGKALRATKENLARFEGMKAQLEVRNLERRGEAEKVAEKLDGKTFTVLRQASDIGQLYGSVTTRDIAGLLVDAGFTVDRSQVAINAPIKTVGSHSVPLVLHPELTVAVAIIVARNADEAERIGRGEDVTARREDREVADAAAEEFFENPEAGQAGLDAEEA
ncbi:50S ribosomal protein L9 [Rhodoplanes serenus]|jgi:large subunit ribosomal protein L9|uniref:Large ribosomal subunit protein bL9 n=1 Tax=Rhodoplanes serenus TaxID=200615 RepID=A0A447CU80_9BRAD|nr:50S ribosomal protein L9 [Rhodoplanes serenus]MBI5113022.1 50S ribosomal protein L9 [Rhodovulum sp.]MTW17319.1 50S ribosomal protein L9 [Rhodoplanes serenus]VCU08789.1 50S ribosomal protein L9 [Rhodoplanes serenus]